MAARRPPRAKTFIARLPAPQAAARRICDQLAEMLDPDHVACSVIESADGAWHVELHFVPPPDPAAVRALIASAFGQARADSLEIAPLAHRDWIAASLGALTPVRAGRFVVHGRHSRALVPANRIAVEIEASLAFGTGHHGTTRGCLLALDALAKGQESRPVKSHGRSETARSKLGNPPGRQRAPGRPGHRKLILDLGTGTGVLAIAAAKRFRGRVLAADIDRRAVRIARDNVRANGVTPFVETIHASGFTAARLARVRHFDLVLANILLAPLQRLAAPVARRLIPGGRVVLSGLLAAHGNAALAAYRAQSLALERRIALDGWVTLILKRPLSPRAGCGRSVHR